MATRLAFHRLAAVDLAVEDEDGNDAFYRCEGIFLRKHNDEVPLEVLPGVTLPKKSRITVALGRSRVARGFAPSQAPGQDGSWKEQSARLT
jgi:hypothetical protein